MINQDFYIDNNKIILSFAEHLKDSHNNRILFSAPFGAGKSTFLKQFFAKADEFHVINLNPVNYAVASNEDIFELIKYDIVLQLLENFKENLKLSKNDFPILWVIQSFVTNKLDLLRLTKAFFKAAVPGYDKVEDFINAIEDTGKDFFKFKDDLKKSEEDHFKGYLKQFYDTKGSLYEMDEMTIIIKSFIEKIRAETDKSFVLIVDDLDRLDPEHIFRLFNVFSAHYNNDYSVNKFSFDKVIFVCDVKNIHNIFSNKYGQDVEFSGYIDKFYSIDIFHFDNVKYVQEIISTLVGKRYKGIPEEYYNAYFFGPRMSEFYHLFEYLTVHLIEAKLLKLRNLLKLRYYGLPNQTINFKTQRYDVGKFPFLVLVNLLRQFFGTLDELEHSFKTLANKYDNLKSIRFLADRGYDIEYLEKSIITDCIPFIVPDETKFYETREAATPFDFSFTRLKGEEVKVYCQYPRFRFDNIITSVNLLEAVSLKTGEQVVLNPFEMFYLALQRAIFKNRFELNPKPYEDKFLTI